MGQHAIENLAGKMDLSAITHVEKLAFHAWPGLELLEVDGWLLRHAGGVTRRANSVWPNEVMAGLSLEARVARVEEFYAERKLPARFQICPAVQPVELDLFLAQRGYRMVARTAVQFVVLEQMLVKLRDMALVSQRVVAELQVEVNPQPDAVWWQCYAAADEVEPASVAGRKAICAQISQDSAYAVVHRSGNSEGEAIAVGSATVEGRFAGFLNVATVQKSRRLGAAQMVMIALGKWAVRQGAQNGYLQVMDENKPAKELYGRLGFEIGYYYHYREQV